MLKKIFIMAILAVTLFTERAEADTRSREAFEFIVSGDNRDPLIRSVKINQCISEVIVDTIIFGDVLLAHDWNQAIWNSKQYYMNENGQYTLLISCRDICATYSGEEGFQEMLAFGAMLQGVDLTRSISIDIAASQSRVDAALRDLESSCPGVSSRY